MFRLGYLPVVVLSAGSAIAILSFLFTSEPYASDAQRNLETCKYPADLVEPVRSLICILEPAFVATMSQPLGLTSVYLFIQIWLPLSLWLFQEGGKPGRSVLLSPVVAIILSALGQSIGLGPAFAIFLPLLLAIVKSRGGKREGLPAPAAAAYTRTNLFCHAFMLVVSLAGLQVSPTKDMDLWRKLNWAFQIFPLYFLPLVFVPIGRPSWEKTREPTTLFNSLSLLFTLTWWLNIATFAFFWAGDNFQPLSPQVIFMLLDAAALIIAFLGIWAVDAVAGDAKGLPNILVDSLWAGPPAAWALYAAAKETQSAKRIELLEDTE